MPLVNDLALGLAIACAALLYASVGQAGGSAYIAIMALLALEPAQIKPVSLALNTVAAAVGTAVYWRAARPQLRLLVPLILTSIPFAFIGGMIALPERIYQPLVGGILLYAALRLVLGKTASGGTAVAPPPVAHLMLGGMVIGFASGITGIGGGIFLAPLLLIMGWANMRSTASLSVGLNLLNSAAGLAGIMSTVGTLPAAMPGWCIAVALASLAGALIGRRLGSSRALTLVLAAILAAAGLRLFVAAF